MIHTIFRAVEGSGRASLQPSFSPRASPLLSGPCSRQAPLVPQPYTIYYIIVCVFFTAHFR